MKTNSAKQAVLAAALAVSASLVTGCAGRGTAGPTGPTASTRPVIDGGVTAATDSAATTEPAVTGSGAAFWFDLARKGAVTNDEATRALLEQLDDPAARLEYPSRLASLKSRGFWPADSNALAGDKVRRGDLAVAICKALDIRGGVTTRVFGLSPRYATRALMFEGIYPESTPNQSLTGSAFVGIIGAIDDRRRGNPADLPAEQIPGYVEPELAVDGSTIYDYRVEPLVYSAPGDELPLYMMFQDGTTQPAGITSPGAPRKLKVVITAIQGDQAEFRRSETAAWEKARPLLVLDENAEFRTGDKSSIRLSIPPGQQFTVDRLTTMKVAEASWDGQKVKTTVGLEQGRVRMDVNETPEPIKRQIRKVDEGAFNIAEAGVVHDTQIRSPNSALAVRGTRVSLLDQPPYAPLATSLTGRAEFLNTRRQAVAFGAVGKRSQVEGDQGSSGESASKRNRADIPPAASASAFDAAQLNRVLATGGFLRGDVIVGNAPAPSSLASLVPRGTEVAFVLFFGNPGDNNFQDLNLAVAAPGNNANSPDFVANGPFTQSLNTSRPGYDAYRRQNYPKTSRSGGAISRNAVSVPPQFAGAGREQFFRSAELATWTRNAPQGVYTVAVTNFIDVPDNVTPAPAGKGSKPVDAIVQVVINGRAAATLTGAVVVDPNRPNNPPGRDLNSKVGLYDTLVFQYDTVTGAQTPLPTVTPTGDAPARLAANRAPRKKR